MKMFLLRPFEDGDEQLGPRISSALLDVLLSQKPAHRQMSPASLLQSAAAIAARCQTTEEKEATQQPTAVVSREDQSAASGSVCCRMKESNPIEEEEIGAAAAAMVTRELLDAVAHVVSSSDDGCGGDDGCDACANLLARWRLLLPDFSDDSSPVNAFFLRKKKMKAAVVDRSTCEEVCVALARCLSVSPLPSSSAPSTRKELLLRQLWSGYDDVIRSLAFSPQGPPITAADGFSSGRCRSCLHPVLGPLEDMAIRAHFVEATEKEAVFHFSSKFGKPTYDATNPQMLLAFAQRSFCAALSKMAAIAAEPSQDGGGKDCATPQQLVHCQGVLASLFVAMFSTLYKEEYYDPVCGGGTPSSRTSLRDDHTTAAPAGDAYPLSRHLAQFVSWLDGDNHSCCPATAAFKQKLIGNISDRNHTMQYCDNAVRLSLRRALTGTNDSSLLDDPFWRRKFLPALHDDDRRGGGVAAVITTNVLRCVSSIVRLLGTRYLPLFSTATSTSRADHCGLISDHLVRHAILGVADACTRSTEHGEREESGRASVRPGAAMVRHFLAVCDEWFDTLDVVVDEKDYDEVGAALRDLRAFASFHGQL